jgi:hypothetical protein
MNKSKGTRCENKQKPGLEYCGKHVYCREVYQRDTQICLCINQSKGKRCGNKAKPGLQFCGVHANCRQIYQKEPSPLRRDPSPSPLRKEPSPKKNQIPNIFAQLIPKGSWECETCQLNNPENNDKCMACGTLKDGSNKLNEIQLLENVEKPKKTKKTKKVSSPGEEVKSPEIGFTDYDKRGVDSVITAFKVLKTLSLKKSASVDIYINNSSSASIRVYYNSVAGLDKMFAVYEGYNRLGVDKELMLYGGDLKSYIDDVFTRKNKKRQFEFKITKIDVNINNNIKLFYIDSLGIVWNQDDCADCHLKKRRGEKLDLKCEMLINNNCADNFRNRP